MRLLTPLLVAPLVFGFSGRASIDTRLDAAPAMRTADNIPVSVRWNRLVPKFLEEAAANRKAARKAAAGDSAALRRIAQSQPPMLLRVYTVLSVAQYAAVNSASENRSVSIEAAVASASATVLTELLTDPAVRASITRELARDLDNARAASRASDRIDAGKVMGEDIARRVIGWAPTINLVAPWNGTIPTGPGMWYSAAGVPPIGVSLASTRPWLLDSTSQFRPPPPPAYGSAAWKAAMEEVQRVARERTRQQTEIAQRWNASDPWAMWNETAAEAIRRNNASEKEAARVLAILNVGATDAVVACFEAKYHYWTIRPSQADSTLVLADSVGLPNFPSYPSGHACSAGAFDAVLTHYFPKDREIFNKISSEQAMSRLYGGIHYRFDNDGGVALGRTVALYDVEREKRGALKALLKGALAQKR
jgi:hypothetical protein